MEKETIKTEKKEKSTWGTIGALAMGALTIAGAILEATNKTNNND